MSADETGSTQKEALQMDSDALVEVLGVNPDEIIDDIVNMANTLMYNALAETETFVQRELGPGHPEVKEGIAKVETLLEQATDHAFDAFEAAVRARVFAAPRGLGWLAYQASGLDLDVTDEQVQAVGAEVAELRAAVAAAQRKAQGLEALCAALEGLAGVGGVRGAADQDTMSALTLTTNPNPPTDHSAGVAEAVGSACEVAAALSSGLEAQWAAMARCGTVSTAAQRAAMVDIEAEQIFVDSSSRR